MTFSVCALCDIGHPLLTSRLSLAQQLTQHASMVRAHTGWDLATFGGRSWFQVSPVAVVSPRRSSSKVANTAAGRLPILLALCRVGV